MPDLLWSPSPERIQNANVTHYQEWLRDTRNLEFTDYHTLWQWSVDHPDDFWETLLHYFNVQYGGEYSKVVSDTPMPHCQWFEGIHLNYAEHIFRKATRKFPAMIFQSESTNAVEISWEELEAKVSALQQYFRAAGVGRGDRIVAYIPCIPEATIAFLAANSLGAVWSACSPDFGTQSVIDRFAQIGPKVLIAVTGYRYNGKSFDKHAVVDELIKALPTLGRVVLISDGKSKRHLTGAPQVISWDEAIRTDGGKLSFDRVPFSHPIWVLYSSGTTGLPKAITHSHGGILLEQLKYGTFHNDFKPGERCFWYTTTGWMMWNYIHGSLLAGGTLVLYDGSPACPDLHVLWKFIQDAGIHHFGTSAGYLLANRKEGLQPGGKFNLAHLKSVGSTGSTLPPEGFDWVYREVKEDLWLASMSGGTDVCSAFVGGNPAMPVYSGEIQCRALGCRLEAFNEEGKPVVGEVGEMVITAPMPSMPVYFWNDPDFERYRASYFENYPGVWRHGDWIEITERHGVIIYGRSDATLNRGGVRIGTSEIYRAVDKVREVKDSLIVCIEKKGGEFWMPLFVVMQEGQTFTEELGHRIRSVIRADYSPRHVPDEIIAVADIPYTISGKKTETPVKKVLMGKHPDEVISRGALKNPASIQIFTKWAEKP